MNIKNFFIASFLIFSLSIKMSQAQVLNPGFESLNSDGSIQHWGIMHVFSVWFDSTGVAHSDSIVIDQSFCQTSVDAHSGNRAVEMRNAYNYTANEGIAGGAFISSDTSFSTYSSFVPIVDRPTNMSFYYKYFPVNQDTASAFIEVLDINGVTIGTGMVKISALTSGYTYLGVPIAYISTDSAAFISIQFLASSRNKLAQFGTRFLVDDISLTSPLAVSNSQLIHSIKFSPNPVQTHLNIQSNEQIQSVTIFNQLGQIAKQQNTNCERVDCSQVSNGNYIVEVVTAKGKQYNNISIQRY